MPDEKRERSKKRRSREKTVRDLRRLRAVELKIEGHSEREIAKMISDEAGRYVSNVTIHKDIKAYLEEQADKATTSLEHWRAINVGRMEKLIAAHFENAIGGDTAATETVLKIIKEELKLLGIAYLKPPAGSDPDHPLYVSFPELAKLANARAYQTGFDEVEEISDLGPDDLTELEELQALPPGTLD